MKTCTLCKESKELSEFYKRTVSPDGVDCRCKPCRLWSSNSTRDKAKNLAKALQWQRENKDRANKKSADWRAKNRDRRNEIARAWAARNPDKRRDAVVRRRLRLVTPCWANTQEITRFYKEANLKTKKTGIPHHVDHVVPVSSDLVCGLHVEFNLAVLPASENVRKQNRFWPDMP